MGDFLATRVGVQVGTNLSAGVFVNLATRVGVRVGADPRTGVFVNLATRTGVEVGTDLRAGVFVNVGTEANTVSLGDGVRVNVATRIAKGEAGVAVGAPEVKGPVDLSLTNMPGVEVTKATVISPRISDSIEIGKRDSKRFIYA